MCIYTNKYWLPLQARNWSRPRVDGSIIYDKWGFSTRNRRSIPIAYACVLIRAASFTFVLEPTDKICPWRGNCCVRNTRFSVFLNRKHVLIRKHAVLPILHGSYYLFKIEEPCIDRNMIFFRNRKIIALVFSIVRFRNFFIFVFIPRKWNQLLVSFPFTPPHT